MSEDEKTNMEKSLEQIFNLEEAQPIVEAIKEEHDIDLNPEVVEGELVEGEDKADQDINYAISNIRELIDNSSDVVATLSRLAKSSESPRAFEVLSTLINTLVNANKEIVDIHKKSKQIQLSQDPRQGTHIAGGTTYNQTVYVGSTKALQEYLTRHSANT